MKAKIYLEVNIQGTRGEVILFFGMGGIRASDQLYDRSLEKENSMNNETSPILPQDNTVQPQSRGRKSIQWPWAETEGSECRAGPQQPRQTSLS